MIFSLICIGIDSQNCILFVIFLFGRLPDDLYFFWRWQGNTNQPAIGQREKKSIECGFSYQLWYKLAKNHLKNTENEETAVVNNDCDFVDNGGVKQSLSDGNKSWKIWNLFLFRLQDLLFFHTSLFYFSLCLSFSKTSFYNLTCDETVIRFSIQFKKVGYMVSNPKL